MIIAIRNEDMGVKVMGQFYDSMYDFFVSTFKWHISVNGVITVDGREMSVSYDMNQWDPNSVLRDFVGRQNFKDLLKENFWTIYKTTKIV